MTTPQSTLNNLEYRIRRVCELLEGEWNDEGDEGRANIIDRLSELELQNDKLITSYQNIENTLRLIVKLLDKWV